MALVLLPFQWILVRVVNLSSRSLGNVLRMACVLQQRDLFCAINVR